jgi:hypothetical protein
VSRTGFTSGKGSARRVILEEDESAGREKPS